MVFEKEIELYSYDVRRESGESVAYVNYLGAPFLPSIAKFPEVFSRVIDMLIESPNVSRIVFVQQRNYNYDGNEVKKLIEIANLYNFLLKQERVLPPERLGNDISKRHNFMSFFMNLLKSDPIAAYFKVKNSLKDESSKQDSYDYLLKKPKELKYFYHLMPPEYFLNEDYQMLLNLARNVLIEHQPKAEEFTDPERTRQVFFNVARDLISELAVNKGIKLSYSDLDLLANILVRHTIGFGLLEILLQDKHLQDIVLNAPIPLNPIFVRHSEFDECFSNIFLSQDDADSWAAKFRMISGRPLDEANPILDTDLTLENVRARISIVQRPLSPNGLAYAVRRHRDYPWTLPLFIENGMIDSFSAGLLSFLIDGARTLLIAGTRSSGKTSLLGSLMLEMKPKYRMILIEDTLELPNKYFRKLGYDILSMKVRSSLQENNNEISAEEGIRASLRLGESSLIVGEIRSTEANALYEAMRVGALANVVAGTVHGSSPYSV